MNDLFIFIFNTLNGPSGIIVINIKANILSLKSLTDFNVTKEQFCQLSKTRAFPYSLYLICLLLCLPLLV